MLVNHLQWVTSVTFTGSGELDNGLNVSLIF